MSCILQPKAINQFLWYFQTISLFFNIFESFILKKKAWTLIPLTQKGVLHCIGRLTWGFHRNYNNFDILFLFRTENALYFLTSWNVKINLPDNDGNFTPLHLAVISGNAKVVRRLLIKGALTDSLVLIFFIYISLQGFLELKN